MEVALISAIIISIIVAVVGVVVIYFKLRKLSLRQEIYEGEIKNILQDIVKRIYRLEEEYKSVKSANIEPVKKEEVVREEKLVVSEAKQFQTGEPDQSTPAQKIVMPTPTKLAADLEVIFGLSWLSKVGMIAIVFGIGFFLKYSFENNWIGETGRVLMGLLSGGILLFLGDRCFRKDYKIFAHTFMGGGIAILYLSIFGAFAYYHLIEQQYAFAAMIIVTLSAIALSVLHNTFIIGQMALIGGFLTPILLSTGVDKQIALFSYIVLLDIIGLGIAYFKNWHIINYTAFLGTILIFSGWYDRFYRDSKLTPTFTFLTVFFFIFLVMSCLYQLVRRKKISVLGMILFVANAFIYFAASYALLDRYYHSLLAFFAIILAGVYFLFFMVSFLRIPEDKYALMMSLGTALTFLTIAIPIRFEMTWITLMWALEGLLLLFLGFKYRNYFTVIASMVVFVIVIGRILIIDLWNYKRVTTYFILNKHFISLFFSVVPFFVCTYLYRKVKEAVGAYGNIPFPQIFSVTGHILLILLLSTEIDYWKNNKISLLHNERIEMEKKYYGTNKYGYYYPDNASREYRQSIDKIYGEIRNYGLLSSMSLSLLWALYALALIIFGIVKDIKYLRGFALILLAITVVKVFFVDIGELEKLYRILSFIGVGILLLVGAYFYNKFTPKKVGEELI